MKNYIQKRKRQQILNFLNQNKVRGIIARFELIWLQTTDFSYFLCTCSGTIWIFPILQTKK